MALDQPIPRRIRLEVIGRFDERQVSFVSERPCDSAAKLTMRVDAGPDGGASDR